MMTPCNVCDVRMVSTAYQRLKLECICESRPFSIPWIPAVLHIILCMLCVGIFELPESAILEKIDIYFNDYCSFFELFLFLLVFFHILFSFWICVDWLLMLFLVQKCLQHENIQLDFWRPTYYDVLCEALGSFHVLNWDYSKFICVTIQLSLQSDGFCCKTQVTNSTIETGLNHASHWPSVFCFGLWH